MIGSEPSANPPSIELDGRRYVVLREAEYARLLAAAKGPLDGAGGWALWEEDAAHLAARLTERRKDAGWTQAALARAAGLRVETLNRLERGHQSPDFTTVRRLVAVLREYGGARSRSGGRKGGKGR